MDCSIGERIAVALLALVMASSIMALTCQLLISPTDRAIEARLQQL